MRRPPTSANHRVATIRGGAFSASSNQRTTMRLSLSAVATVIDRAPAIGVLAAPHASRMGMSNGSVRSPSHDKTASDSQSRMSRGVTPRDGVVAIALVTTQRRSRTPLMAWLTDVVWGDCWSV